MPDHNSLVKAIFIWSLSALFYFYDNLLQISPSAMKPELSQAFNILAEDFGGLAAYCLYAYGLMQIPAGLLVDKYGSRKFLTLACFLCALGSLSFGMSQTLWQAKLARILVGLGASFAVVSCLQISTNWFMPKRFALMTGATVTIGFLGSVFGSGMMSSAVNQFGWRQTMNYGWIFGAVLGLLIWAFVRDQGPYARSAEQLDQNNIWRGLAKVMQNKQIWFASTYAGLMFVPTLAFGGLWGISFLVEAKGMSRVSSGWLNSLIYLGWMVGGPFFGWLSDHIKQRNLPMWISNLATLVVILIIVYFDGLKQWQLGTLLFGLGFTSSGFIIAYAVVRENIHPKQGSTAIGFTNALNTFGGAIVQPLIGRLLDYSNASPLTLGFSLQDYKLALSVLPCSLVLALIALYFIQETNCQGQN